MVSVEENQLLTQTSRSTAAGELLRRYWQPILPTVRLGNKPVRVRVLGENLVLYRDLSGELGLIQERCPHRSASLLLGMPEADGLRCRYHGWKFDRNGRCLEQPFEDTVGSGSFKDHIAVDAYKVQELGGLIFAYLGPEPAPLLPRLDILVDTDRWFHIQTSVIACNWLQCMENSLDPVHFEWLHAQLFNFLARSVATRR